MKKILFVLFAGVVSGIISCSGASNAVTVGYVNLQDYTAKSIAPTKSFTVGALSCPASTSCNAVYNANSTTGFWGFAIKDSNANSLKIYTTDNVNMTVTYYNSTLNTVVSTTKTASNYVKSGPDVNGVYTLTINDTFTINGLNITNGNVIKGFGY